MAQSLKSLKFSDQVVVPADLEDIKAGDAENLGPYGSAHYFVGSAGGLTFTEGSGNPLYVLARPYEDSGSGSSGGGTFSFIMERSACGYLWLYGGQIWQVDCPDLGSSAGIGSSGMLRGTRIS